MNERLKEEFEKIIEENNLEDFNECTYSFEDLFGNRVGLTFNVDFGASRKRKDPLEGIKESDLLDLKDIVDEFRTFNNKREEVLITIFDPVQISTSFFIDYSFNQDNRLMPIVLYPKIDDSYLEFNSKMALKSDCTKAVVKKFVKDFMDDYELCGAEITVIRTSSQFKEFMKFVKKLEKNFNSICKRNKVRAGEIFTELFI